jgi:ribosomal protein S4
LGSRSSLEPSKGSTLTWRVPSKLRILVHQLPERAQIEIPLTEQLIVELYSK